MSPVGALPGASAFFDADLSQGNTFSSVGLKVCGNTITASSTVSWWDPSLSSGSGGWAQIVGDPGPTFDSTGPVPCLDATLDGASYPSLTQLTGTVLGLSALAPGSVTTTSSRLAVSPRTQVLYTARIVPSKTSVVTGTVSFTDRGRVIPSCRDLPLTAGKAVCAVRYSGDGSHIVVATYSGDSKFPESRSNALTEFVGTAPEITLQPKSATVTVGHTVTLKSAVRSSPSSSVHGVALPTG